MQTAQLLSDTTSYTLISPIAHLATNQLTHPNQSFILAKSFFFVFGGGGGGGGDEGDMPSLERIAERPEYHRKS